MAGRYALERQLGSGAAGVVWLGQHLVLQAPVAIKFLDPTARLNAGATEHMDERFRFEAQVSARLAPRTTRIVTVHDAGTFQDVPFLVMEFVEGESLEAWLDRELVPPEAVASMIEHVAEALEQAHRLGIAHRDVKPANILVVRGEEGACAFKLADFGVAKLLRESSPGLAAPRRTAERALVGSPAYMCPEVATGGAVVDGGPDVWALAASAYEALTRRLPFDGATITELYTSLLAFKFKPPSQVMTGLPPRVDAFFAKAFAPEPADRFATPRELAEAFRAALRGATIRPEERNKRRADLSPLRRTTPIFDEETGGPTALRITPDGQPETPLEPERRRRWVPVVALVSAGAALLAGALWLRAARAPNAGVVPSPAATPVIRSPDLAASTRATHGPEVKATSSSSEREVASAPSSVRAPAANKAKTSGRPPPSAPTTPTAAPQTPAASAQKTSKTPIDESEKQ